MGNCFFTQLAGSANNDNLEVFDSLVVTLVKNNIQKNNILFQASGKENTNGNKVTLLEGDGDVLCPDNSTTISVGESFDNQKYIAGYYKITTPGTYKIMIERPANILALILYSDDMKTAPSLENVKRAWCATSINVGYKAINTTVLLGSIEPLVEYRAKYADSVVDCTINGWGLQLNGKLINNSPFYIENSAEDIYVKGGKTELVLYATYHKSDGSWTYSS